MECPDTSGCHFRIHLTHWCQSCCFAEAVDAALNTKATQPQQQTWNFAALIWASLVGFAYHSFWLVIKDRGYQHDAIWHEAQAWAGIAFICIIWVRMLVAALCRESNQGGKIYLALIILSPFWIRGLFEFVLAIWDATSR